MIIGGGDTIGLPITDMEEERGLFVCLQPQECDLMSHYHFSSFKLSRVRISVNKHREVALVELFVVGPKDYPGPNWCNCSIY